MARLDTDINGELFISCSCDAMGVEHVYHAPSCDPNYAGPPKPFARSISQADNIFDPDVRMEEIDGSSRFGTI